MPSSVGKVPIVEYLQEAYEKDLVKVINILVLFLTISHFLVLDQRYYAKDPGARILDRTRVSRYLCHALWQEIVQSLRFQRKA